MSFLLRAVRLRVARTSSVLLVGLMVWLILPGCRNGYASRDTHTDSAAASTIANPSAFPR